MWLLNMNTINENMGTVDANLYEDGVIPIEFLSNMMIIHGQIISLGILDQIVADERRRDESFDALSVFERVALIEHYRVVGHMGDVVSFLRMLGERPIFDRIYCGGSYAPPPYYELQEDDYVHNPDYDDYEPPEEREEDFFREFDEMPPLEAVDDYAADEVVPTILDEFDYDSDATSPFQTEDENSEDDEEVTIGALSALRRLMINEEPRFTVMGPPIIERSLQQPKNALPRFMEQKMEIDRSKDACFMTHSFVRNISDPQVPLDLEDEEFCALGGEPDVEDGEKRSMNVMIPLLITTLTMAYPNIHKLGFSTVLIFMQQMYLSTSTAHTLVAVQTLINGFQNRFGSGIFKNLLKDLVYDFYYSRVAEFQKADDLFQGDAVGPDGTDKSLRESYFAYIENLSQIMTDGFRNTQNDFSNIGTTMLGKMEELEWNPKWTIYITTFKNSKLFELCSECVKYAAALYAVATFSDGEEVISMMDKIMKSKWYKNIKLISSAGIVVFSLMAIFREISSMYARSITGEPLFQLDELFIMQGLLQDIRLRLGERQKNVTLDLQGRKKISSDLSKDYMALYEKFENYKLTKCTGTLRPDLRNHLNNMSNSMKELKILIGLTFNRDHLSKIEPYTFTLIGTAGVGKSMIANDAHVVLSSRIGKPTDLQYRYVMNMRSKFDDTAGGDEHSLLVDDLGASNPEMDRDAVVTFCKIIGIVNTIPEPIIKADVDSKGKMFHNYDFCCFTMNPAGLFVIKSLMMTESAITRRLGLIVEPILQEAFRSADDPTKLDYAKYNEKKGTDFDGSYPWKFRVGRYHNSVGGRDESVLVYEKKIYTYPELLEKLATGVEDRMRSGMDNKIIDARKCRVCGKFNFESSHVDCKVYTELPIGNEWTAAVGPYLLLDEEKEYNRTVSLWRTFCRVNFKTPKLGFKDRVKKYAEDIYHSICDIPANIAGFITKGMRITEVNYTYEERLCALIAIIILKILVTVKVCLDSTESGAGTFFLSMNLVLVLTTGNYLFIGGVASIFLLAYSHIHRNLDLNLSIMNNAIATYWSILRTGRSGLCDRWNLFSLVAPKAASIMTVTGSCFAVIATVLTVQRVFMKDEYITSTVGTIESYKDFKKNDEVKIRRGNWNAAATSAALATAAYFIYKAKVPEIHVKSKAKEMAVIVTIKTGESEGGIPIFSMPACGTRFSGGIILPKHTVDGTWWPNGCFNDNSGTLIKIQSMAGSEKIRRVIYRYVRYEDFTFHDFDYCYLNVADYWGHQATKLDECFGAYPADFDLNLLGTEGFIYFPLRDVIVDIKFVQRSNDKYAVFAGAKKYTEIGKQNYINSEGVKKLNYVMDGESVQGDCHCPVWAKVQGIYQIVGFHTQIETYSNITIQVGGAYTTTKDILYKLQEKAFISAQEAGFTLTPIQPVVDVEVKSFQLHDKDRLITSEHEVNALPIGQMNHSHNATMSSRVNRSPVYDLFIEDLNKFEVTYGPPKFKGELSEDGKVWIDPMDKMVKSMEPNWKVIDNLLFKDATVEFYEDVIKDEDLYRFRRMFPLSDSGEGNFLSLFEALNGVGDGKEIAGMNFKSSAGNILKGAKKLYIVKNDSLSLSFGRDIYELNDEVQNMYEERWSEIMDGDITRRVPIVRTHLKDEVRPKGKAARVFFISDFVDLIIMRRILGRILYFLKLDRSKTECQVGINCASSQWKDLRDHLKRYGPANIDLDFSGFDLLLKRPLMAIIYNFFYIPLAKFLGFTDSEMKILRSALSCELFTCICINGDLIITDGNNCSGKGDTVEMNCIFNSILKRMVFNQLKLKTKLLEDIKRRYRNEVSSGTYGDDSDENPSERVLHFYDYVSIRDQFATMNVKVTPARKDDGDYKHKSIEDVFFLKRSFVDGIRKDINGVEHKLVLAPLDEASIYKALCWQVDSKQVTKEQQSLSTLESMVLEMWMHGEEKFNTFRDKAKEAAKLLGDPNFEFKTFQTITTQYLEGTYATMFT